MNFDLCARHEEEWRAYATDENDKLSQVVVRGSDPMSLSGLQVPAVHSLSNLMWYSNGYILKHILVICTKLNL